MFLEWFWNGSRWYKLVLIGFAVIIGCSGVTASGFGWFWVVLHLSADVPLTLIVAPPLKSRPTSGLKEPDSRGTGGL